MKSMRRAQGVLPTVVVAMASIGLVHIVDAQMPSSQPLNGRPIRIPHDASSNIEPVHPVHGPTEAIRHKLGRTRAWAAYTLGFLPGVVDIGDVMSKPLSLIDGNHISEFFDNRGADTGEENWTAFNLGLLEAPVPGDFLPVGTTIADGSMALVPSVERHESLGWNGIRRETLHDAVDLVTGVPLVRINDLTLPFGGAEFRLNRTRSANRVNTGKTFGNEYAVSTQDVRWWDWVGQGWMMSENPILLIDSRLPDVVGDGPARTWLWLDAHHSIPFDWVNNSSGSVHPVNNLKQTFGGYDCAPRYRARLRALRGGVESTDSTNAAAPRRLGTFDKLTNPERDHPSAHLAGDWMPGHYPDSFEVALYDGALTYTFDPVYEDVPTWLFSVPTPAEKAEAGTSWRNLLQYSSLHGRPLLPTSLVQANGEPITAGASATAADSQNLAAGNWHPWRPTPKNLGRASGFHGAGLGMPYYGLLRQIKDRQGNRVEIEYATVLAWSVDGIREVTSSTQKGAVSRIRLVSADGVTAWTLVYTYRLVPRSADLVAGPSGAIDLAPPLSIAATMPVAGESDHNSYSWATMGTVWRAMSPQQRVAWSDPVLECVYVFKGEVDTRGITLVRPPEHSLWGANDADARRWATDEDDLLKLYQSNDIVALYQSAPPPAAGRDIKSFSDWKFRVRHWYASTDLPNGLTPGDVGTGIPYGTNGTGPILQGVRSQPLLVRTETQIRDDESATVRSLQNHVYQYEAEGPFHHTRWMHSIYNDAGMKRVHDSIRVSQPATLEETIRDLASGKTGRVFPSESQWDMGFKTRSTSSGATTVASVTDYREAAVLWLGRANVGGVWNSESPSLTTVVPGTSITGFERPPLDALAQDGLIPENPTEYVGDSSGGTVAAFSVNDPIEGRRRHYRVYRLMRAPGQFLTAGPGQFDRGLWGGAGWPAKPHRSIFSNPFKWQAHASRDRWLWPTMRQTLYWKTEDGPGSVASKASTEVDYAEHRWVVIVDEFPSWESARSAPPLAWSVLGKASFFEGQLSRRIIGLSPAGNLFWEKTYTLSGNRFTEGGDTGLNESYVYKTGQEIVLDQHPSVQPSEISDGLRTELFLVQKRSVGWAAAELANHGDDPNRITPTDQVKRAGLVWNFHYKDVSSSPLPTPASQPQVPNALSWGERLKPVGESIQCGNVANTPFYITSQTFYDPADPTIVLGAARFTKPTSAMSSTLAAALLDPDIITTRASTIKDPDPSSPGSYRRIVSISASPPRFAAPGSTAPMADVSMTVSNRRGQVVWSISAFIPLADSIERIQPGDITPGSGPHARIRLTYYKYDSWGRPTDTYVDVTRGSSFVTSEDLAILDPGIDRVEAAGGPPAAELRTARIYNDYGLSDVISPSGKRWSRRVERNVANPDTSFNKGRPFDRVYTMYDLSETSATSPLEPLGVDGRSFTTSRAGDVKDYARYRGDSGFIRSFQADDDPALRSMQVRFTGDITFNAAAFTTVPPFERMGTVEIAYDSSGRPSAATSIELAANGESVSVSAEILDNADRVSTFEWDGTHTRRVRNARGQIVRTYIGTLATAKTLPWDIALPPQNPDPGPTGDAAFDMLLRERVEYGRHWSNALQPVRQWSYLDRPSSSEWTSEALKPFGPAPQNDPEGQRSDTRFDWRMRPVRVDTYGPQGANSVRPLHSSRLTFLDHADRPVLEATYLNALPPADRDPSIAPDAPSTYSASGPTALPPSAQDVLSAAPAPASLTETIYFPDGSVKERRTYRTPAPGAVYAGSAEFHAERYFYGFGGKQTFAERSESPIQISTLDNFGRVLSESTVLPRTSAGTTLYDLELTRTDYRYDPEGNVVLTDRLERLRAPTSATDVAPPFHLVAGVNASGSRTETWYDLSNRVIAVREHGDQHAALGAATLDSIDAALASHTFNPNLSPRISVNIDVVPATFSTSPAFTSLGTGRWTFHAYDRAGLKIATLAPDGKLTAFRYDNKGRLLKEVANAAATEASHRTTEHAYWLGRLISTFTKRTDQAGTEQFQSVAYGAQIVGVRKRLINHDRSLKIKDAQDQWVDPSAEVEVDDFEYISNSNQLVGAMMSVSPHKDNLELVGPAGGQTLQARALVPLIKSMLDFQYARPDFAYRYYADGLLAERVDRRGVAIRYYYDDQRRLSAQEVWNYESPVLMRQGPVGDHGEPTQIPFTDRNLWKITAFSRFGDPNVGGSATNIPNAVPGYPGWMGIPNSATGYDHPIDRIGFIAYAYDSRGNLERVTAGTSRTAVNATPPAIVAETKYLYDDRSNLIKEIQSHGGSADAPGVPFIDYTRQYTAGASSGTTFSPGRDRLLSMTYPAQTGYSGPRTITFDYGNATGLDALVDRASSYRMGNSQVAGFTYTASGRRVATALGGSATTPWVRQTFDTDPNTPGIEGLDALGRVRDLHYRTATTNPAPTTLWRGQYGYDPSGNRLYERLTQRSPSSSVSGNNTRSRRFFYDAMDRLKSAESGALDAANAVIGPSAAYPGLGAGALPTGLRRESWGLDKLGNWSVDAGNAVPNEVAPSCIPPTIRPPGPGRGDKTVFDPWGPGSGGLVSNAIGHRVEIVTSDGAASERAAKHLPTDFDPAAAFGDQRALNAVRWTLERDANGQETWSRHLTDANGNLVYDGKYFYQYDAWNRLIQINDASQTHWIWFEWTGQRLGTPRIRQPGGQYLGECPADTIGPVIKHYNYDGVGRVFRATTPIDAASLPPSYVFNSNATSFVRSERFFYDGTRRIQEVVTDPIIVHEEGDVLTIGAQMLTPPPEGVGEFTRLKTQYVWGPGDSPTSGVMELLRVTEITKNAAGTTVEYPRVVLYDAQGDVAALVQPPGVTAAAAVTAQWTWSPYGEVLTYEEFYPHQPLHVGHKGLFVDRLNSGPLVFDMYTWTAAERPRLEPGAKLIAHTPNRTYAPDLGRWLQQDPNASGTSTLLLRSFGASGASPLPQTDLEGRLGDGLSLFGYVRGDPVARSDPSGLYSTEDAIEDIADSNFGIPSPSDFITGSLRALVEDYSANQMFDLDWALDWSLPDDDHSRTENSWMALSFGRGLYEAFEIGIGEYKVNPLDTPASAGKNKGGGGGGSNGSGRKSKGGFTPAIANGQAKHAEFRIWMQSLGLETEFTIKGFGRCDAIDFKNKIIYELKPNTPSGRYRAIKQLNKYREGMRQHENMALRGEYQIQPLYYR